MNPGYEMYFCEEGHDKVAFVQEIPSEMSPSEFCPVCERMRALDRMEHDLCVIRADNDELKQALADEKSKKNVCS